MNGSGFVVALPLRSPKGREPCLPAGRSRKLDFANLPSRRQEQKKKTQQNKVVRVN